MGSVVFHSSYWISGLGQTECNVRVSYSESYNMAANKTTVRITGVELQIVGNAVNWGSMPFFGAVKVNGTTLLTMSGGSSVRVSVSGGGYCSVNIPSSSSVDILHNDDGSRTVSFAIESQYLYSGCYYTCALYNNQYPFGAHNQSQNVALTTHPRASSISSCPNAAETQQAITLTVSRNSAAFWHKATFKAGGTTLHTSGAFATSLSCTIPRTWFSSYPSAASLNVTVSVQTYTSSACTTAVGSAVTKTMTVSADAGMKPAVSAGWASLAAYNAGTAVETAGVTGYVKGYSKAQASFDPAKIDMTDAVGASVASYAVSCQGETDNTSPYLTGVLAAASVSVVCTVTDTRGRTASESFPVTVMEYAPPVLSGQQVFRCLSSGTADEGGTYYSVEAALLFSSLAGQNTCTLTAAIAPSGGSFGAETALASGTASVFGPISADTSYTVRLTATDALGNTARYYASLPTRKWAMKFRPDGSGVAFGKAAETDNVFEIAPDWDLEVGGDANVGGSLTLGTALSVTEGGTGADNAAGARANLEINDMTDFEELSLTWSVNNCTGTIAGAPIIMVSKDGKLLSINGSKTVISSFSRSGGNPGIKANSTLRPASTINANIGMRADGTTLRPEYVYFTISTSGQIYIRTSENHTNASGTSMFLFCNSSMIPIS